MTQVIEQDKVAAVHYTGTYPDGEEFDSSKGKEPLHFLVGHQQMISGFEEEMMGAAAGEKREFTLTPDRAYGERQEGAIQPPCLLMFAFMFWSTAPAQLAGSLPNV